MGLLYAKTKIFHFKEKIDSLPENRDTIMAPVHIRIKPTNVCNHSCWYCAYRANNIQLGKDMTSTDCMPLEKMYEIIDDMEEMGVKALTFSGGGEPFCYPYLLQTLKRLLKTNIKFASLTNGAKLDGEVAELFAHAGTWIRVSIDGWDDKSYSCYRGVPEGEFTRVMKNIENFKKLKGSCLLGAVIITDRKNYLHIYDLLKRLKQAGVSSVKVTACFISDTREENESYHKPIFRAVKDLISKAVGELRDENFEVFDSYNEDFGTFEKGYTWCPYLQILTVIGSDQNVYSCQDKAYNVEQGLIGTIKNVKFKDFWFSDKSKFFRINPSVDCRHRCVANLKNKFVLEYLNADQEHLGFV